MDVKLSLGWMRGAFRGGWGDRAITFGPPSGTAAAVLTSVLLAVTPVV